MRKEPTTMTTSRTMVPRSSATANWDFRAFEFLYRLHAYLVKKEKAQKIRIAFRKDAANKSQEAAK